MLAVDPRDVSAVLPSEESRRRGRHALFLRNMGEFPVLGYFFLFFAKKTLETLDGGFRVVENRRCVGWPSAMALDWLATPPETVRAGRVGLNPLRLKDRKYPP